VFAALVSDHLFETIKFPDSGQGSDDIPIPVYENLRWPVFLCLRNATTSTSGSCSTGYSHPVLADALAKMHGTSFAWSIWGKWTPRITRSLRYLFPKVIEICLYLPARDGGEGTEIEQHHPAQLFRQHYRCIDVEPGKTGWKLRCATPCSGHHALPGHPSGNGIPSHESMQEPDLPVAVIHILIWVSLYLTDGRQQRRNSHASRQSTLQNGGSFSRPNFP